MVGMEKRYQPLVLGSSEVDELRAKLVERDAEIARLQAIIDDESPDGPDLPELDPAALAESLRAKGAEVGTITGPPIIGTTDTVNAGPAKRRR
jgi:hypothetical protein